MSEEQELDRATSGKANAKHSTREVLCKDLSAKCLKVPLNVRVDKENLLEFSFIWSIYLYTILLVCALLSHTFM